MTRVIVRDENVGESYFLKVDGSDAVRSCFMFSRLILNDASFMSSTQDGCEVCVECEKMLVAIDNPSCAHGSVKIEGSDVTNKVKVTIHDPDSLSHEDTTCMPTYLDVEDPVEFSLDFDT